MTFRWGPGPVFSYEWLINSRRWVYYAGRSLFVAFLLAALVLTWWSQVSWYGNRLSNRQLLAMVGENFFYAVMGTQLTLILLAAPAVTAGAVCLDKTRGTLLHLLVTDLSSAEIILGKLGTGLINVLALVACSMPVLFLATLVGGVDPQALIAAYLVTVGVAVVVATLALTLSVWCNKTYEVLLSVYFISALALLLDPIWRWQVGVPPAWMTKANPFWLALAYDPRPGSKDLFDALTFLAGSVVLSAILVLPAILRVRAVATGPARGRTLAALPAAFPTLGRLFRWLPGPSLDRNPVLWREWHYNRQSRWMLLVWSVYAILAFAATVLAVVVYLEHGMAAADPGLFVNAFQVAIGLLLVSVSSVTALADDRVRGRLDLLLATPLSTRAILWGKWWGAYRSVILLTLLPCWIACTAAIHTGRWQNVLLTACLILAYGVAVTGFGFALSAWSQRPGRAITLSAIAFVVIAVGPIALVLLFRSLRSEGLVCASPWYGAAVATALAGRILPDHGNMEGWLLLWIVVYTGIGAAFLVAALVALRRGRGDFTYPFWNTAENRTKLLESLAPGATRKAPDHSATCQT
jgi:ABC-type transport system involved in multi-copper enzyme maturation permease subunit